jgi:hypothetical protein
VDTPPHFQEEDEMEMDYAPRSGRKNAQPPSPPSIKKEIKKLSLFQRMMICINVDIQKEQYEAYTERKLILENQEILSKVNKDTDGNDGPLGPKVKVLGYDK